MKLSRLRFSFHRVTTALILFFIVGLTAVFLTAVFSKFEEMAEDGARIIFRQTSSAGTWKLQEMLLSPRLLVRIQAEEGHPEHVRPDTTFQRNIERRFLTALRQSSSTYAFYVGLENGEFFQVVGVRGDPRIREALAAPEGTWFGVRTISARTGANRTETWRFLDGNGESIGQRSQPAVYDARTRPWYSQAIAKDGIVVIDPYKFSSSKEIGLTLSRRLSGGGGVMAADVSIRQLNDSLSRLATTPNSITALIDRNERLIALGKGSQARPAGDLKALTPLLETGNPLLQHFHDLPLAPDMQEASIQKIEGIKFVTAQSAFDISPDTAFRVIAFAPMSEFSGHVLDARNQMILISAVVMLLAVPLVFYFTRRISEVLSMLSSDAERIRAFDFKPTARLATLFKELNNLGEAQRVMKESIQERTQSLETTRAKLEKLIQISLDLGRERDRMTLLRKILHDGRDLLHCDAGTMYMVTERKTLYFALMTNSPKLPDFEIPLYNEDGRPVERYVATWCALHNQPVIIDDIYGETGFDVSGAKLMDRETGYHTVSMLTVPLAPRDGEVIGVLQFLNALDAETGEVVPFDPEIIRFVTALSAEAAVALDNLQLVDAQKKLMDALIRLIAEAIDAKSPYTGGHCERVPELGTMLAEAASAADEGPFADFRFKTADAWREFKIGAWLHDCGKVTTPEYVIDKATKLETIYNRIHEVRMRFEVLLRDAMLDRLESIASGTDTDSANTAFETRKAQLLDDFTFVAECNLGGEFMAPDRIERLKAIAAETWQRHFDDRLGLAHVELERHAGAPETLPVTERLLADKPHHVIPRKDTRLLDPKWGFQVEVPENLYHYGELYNLSIGRGTLSPEERFKINEHVMQSLMMLQQLPLPGNLKRVPEYAGTHHETLIGTGYPRRLTAAELDVPMRIMAIADIFEALTASDRPYKKTKTLSEAIHILARFKDDQHIDADLFELFLTSGVYLRYAEKYLRPEQIDHVDISQYVSPESKGNRGAGKA